MRVYKGLVEAYHEIERDVVEMGVIVKPESMQDKIVKGDEKFETKELIGYSYMVTSEHLFSDVYRFIGELKLDKNYIQQELFERLTYPPVNPGESWKYRKEVWEEFIHNGKFSYTYSERISPHLPHLKESLLKLPNSRQMILPIYRPSDSCYWGGVARVPCSMYYQLLIREEKLQLIYTMRSCDLYTHFAYDVVLARLFQMKMSEYINREPGHFIHFIGSLHIYKKDWNKGVF